VIDRADLKKLARERIRDAEALYRARRYHGAIYICGYAVELALKARICQTLRWSQYRDTDSELRDLKTHKLEVLLRLSGIENRVYGSALPAWSTVKTWGPESRYKPLSSATQLDARYMIDAARVLLRILAP
jgi:hypothetical protein